MSNHAAVKDPHENRPAFKIVRFLHGDPNYTEESTPAEVLLALYGAVAIGAALGVAGVAYFAYYVATNFAQLMDAL